jgi:hypothetical protein
MAATIEFSVGLNPGHSSEWVCQILAFLRWAVLFFLSFLPRFCQ